MDALVLGSGANRGIMLCGVIQCLEREGILQKINTFVGTSVGAFYAGLCAMRISVDDITQITMRFNLGDLLPTEEMELYNLCRTFCMYTNKNKETLLREIVTKFAKRDVTFEELWQAKKTKLVVTTCCLNDGETLYLSRDNFPDMRISRAISMSMTIPILFQPYTLDGKLFVDGATFGHSLPHPPDNANSLGVVLRRNSTKINTFVEYVGSIVSGAIAREDKLKRVIYLETDIQSMALFVDENSKVEMIYKAFKVTEAYLRSNELCPQKQNHDDRRKEQTPGNHEKNAPEQQRVRTLNRHFVRQEHRDLDGAEYVKEQNH